MNYFSISDLAVILHHHTQDSRYIFCTKLWIISEMQNNWWSVTQDSSEQKVYITFREKHHPVSLCPSFYPVLTFWSWTLDRCRCEIRLLQMWTSHKYIQSNKHCELPAECFSMESGVSPHWERLNCEFRRNFSTPAGTQRAVEWRGESRRWR